MQLEHQERLPGRLPLELEANPRRETLTALQPGLLVLILLGLPRKGGGNEFAFPRPFAQGAEQSRDGGKPRGRELRPL